MRILLVNRWYPIGGVGNYVRILSSALADLGHSVTVITSSQYADWPQPKQDTRVALYSIPYPAAPYRLRRLPGIRLHYRAIETLLYARRVEQMRKHLEQREGKCDIVEYAEVNAEGLFHPTMDTPFVVKLHMPAFVFKQVLPQSLGYSTYWIGRWERSLIRRARGVISPSHDLAARVATFCNIDRGRIQFIPNPINLNEFHPGPRSESKNMHILFIGNLDHHKGAFLMAEAIPLIVEHCSRAHVTFVGQNTTLSNGEKGDARIREIVGNAYTDRIDFTGYVAQDALLKLIWDADICVTPSYYENCPYAALEVMACARPLVATRNSGFVEMIQDGETGLLFEPGSAADLADKILRLANDPAYGAELGRRAHEWVRAHYAAPLIAAEQVKYYEQVTNA